jgi:hypothetical protein
MMSFLGYINNAMIKFTIYFNLHMPIVRPGQNLYLPCYKKKFIAYDIYVNDMKYK